MKHISLFLILVLFSACSDKISTILENDSSKYGTFSTRALVDLSHSSSSNPTLLNDWENVERIKLNTIGSNGIDKTVTAPWVSSTSSTLDYTFRHDIKKEDGWVMLFHTFKEIGLDEKQNYMLFYNQFTGYIKVFYYYEGDRDSQGTQWFIKTSDGSSTQLLNLTGYLAGVNEHNLYNMATFSNLTGEPTKGLSPGWNGFEFEVPYCTDYRNIEFTIGAYDKKITYFDFTGNADLRTVGTITPMGNGGGLLSTLASVAGNGAKSMIDDCISEANADSTESTGSIKKMNFGTMLTNAISSIPAGSYVQAISAGLNLIFGKTSSVNYSDVKLTTTGKIEFSGTGSLETTSGIPSITFNLYSMMNSDSPIDNSDMFVYNIQDGQNHFLGVWTLEKYPTITYQRLTRIKKFYKSELYDKDGAIEPLQRRYSFYGETEVPAKWQTMYITINPDLKQYLKDSISVATLMGCDKMDGIKYLSNVVDVDDCFPKKYIYQDSLKSFYQLNDRETNMPVMGLVREIDFPYVVTNAAGTTFRGKQLMFDWGNIDCGRMLDAISITNLFNYKGRNMRIDQSRVYPISYTIDEGVAIDADEYSKDLEIEIRDNQYFNVLRKKAGLPIKDYDY